LIDAYPESWSRPTDRWRQAAAALVADAVPGYNNPQALPLDLNAVARRIGAADIKYLPREVHGFTDWSTDRPTVYLAMSRSDGRRRFTLGHECGHILLGYEGANAETNRLVTADLLTDIELSCDAIAAELLLPFTWLDYFGDYVRDLESASAAARRLRISLATLVVRMGHWGSPTMLFRLVATPADQWVLAHRVGVPPAMRGAMRPDETTRLILHALDDGVHDVEVTFLDAAGIRHSMWANVRRSADSVTMYVARPRTP